MIEILFGQTFGPFLSDDRVGGARFWGGGSIAAGKRRRGVGSRRGVARIIWLTDIESETNLPSLARPVIRAGFSGELARIRRQP